MDLRSLFSDLEDTMLKDTLHRRHVIKKHRLQGASTLIKVSGKAEANTPVPIR